MYSVRIVPFPYLEKEGFKLRPVIQLSEIDEYGTAVCAYVTTKKGGSIYSIEITNLEEAGLEELCFIHAHKLYTLPIEESEIIGTLSKKDTHSLQKKISEVLDLDGI